MQFEPLSYKVIGVAIGIHRAYGPGLLEQAYEDLLDIELTKVRIPFQRQVRLDIDHDGNALPHAYRMDMVIADELVLEIKAVETILPVHRAQLLTYLKLSGYRVGLLMNFNTARLPQGLVRMVN